jgi:YD repeat-containing protein
VSKRILLCAALAVAFCPMFRVFAEGVVSSCTEAALTNALAGGGTVTFACSGTITVTSTKTIAADTVLDANGNSVLISGGDAVRLFIVNTNVTLTMYGITICNGRARNGAGLRNNGGTVEAIDCVFRENQAVGANGATGAAGSNETSLKGGNGTAGQNGQDAAGGAILNLGGTLRLLHCTFESNSATGGNGGNGGAGGTSVSNLGGNGGDGGDGAPAYGGAINSSGSASITNCTFHANSVLGGNAGRGGLGGTTPGAAASYGYNGSPGTGGTNWGGALYSSATLYVLGCTYSTNTSRGGNGAIGGQVDSGADLANGENGSVGGDAFGGAVCNISTTARFINCTFDDNRSTGGTGGNGGNAHANGGFESGNGGRGGHAWGGGVFSSASTFVTNCTFAIGRAVGGTGGSGGTTAIPGSNGSSGNSNGGHVARQAGTFVIRNDLFASPAGGGNGFGTITDGGYNISSDGSISMTAVGSVANTAPGVTALANNGGPTKTRGLQSTSPAINRVTAGSSCLDTDQRGYFRNGACDSGAFEYNGFPPTTVTLLAGGPYATEDGLVGVFSLYRDTTHAVTINYTISGTASNGVDYVAITNSVQLASNIYNTRILIRALSDGITEVKETVTLTLQPALGLVLDPAWTEATVTISETNTFDGAKRFTRGTASDPSYHSFVLPLDYQRGTALDLADGNAATLYPGNPWNTYFYHLNSSNSAPLNPVTNRIAFKNPIAAFGAPSSGSPLYVDQTYRFGFYAGHPILDPANALQIHAYNRSNWSLAGTTKIPIPNINDQLQLTAFLNEGLATGTNAFGLKSTLSFLAAHRWGVGFADPSYEETFILAHEATDTATNYFYVVEFKGVAFFGELMVVNSSGTHSYSKLYVMDFTKRPTARPIFVDQPHFSGIPLPPEYQGKSISELTNNAPAMPNLDSLTPSNYLTINGSPELRRHPILDRFVEDMGRDPIALANYVLNEIALCDMIDYDTNQNQQAAVYLGGVNRSALATFQEGQGSSLEQCALLTYLLRQAGIPAAYVFPTNNGLHLLDLQLSKLMRMQLKGAANAAGQTNLPSMIPVNYPWVAVYITNESRWVHVFPWIKDTEIVEGLNHYEYMPTNYGNGHKWLVQFCLGDTNILALSPTVDQPLELLPKFIQKQLELNAPGLSLDDMGVRIVNRRNHHPRWDDFPKPFSLSGAPLVWESLQTNLSLFNTLQVRVYSAADTNKFIDTSEMRIADLHNRKLLLRYERVGTDNIHDMILSLGAYSPAITNSAAFGTNADPTLKLIATNRLASTDNDIKVRVTHRRLRMMPPGYTAPLDYKNLWEIVYDEMNQKELGLIYEREETFPKGDLAAFASHVGKVSRRMLDVHAEEMWRFNRQADTNNPATLDKEIYQGTTAYLLAASYFSYLSRFAEFNDALHKVNVQGRYAHGFGMLRAQRDTNGFLVSNGAVNLIEPAVHMPHFGSAFVFNSTLRPDTGQDRLSATLDRWYNWILQASAAEHGVLKSYYRTNAVSTVKLLQLAGTNVLRMNRLNYATFGTNWYQGKPLKDHDPSIWNRVVSFFSAGEWDGECLMTPGTITNGTYKGVGAFLISPVDGPGLVGGLNGGIAWQFPTTTFDQQNSINLVPEPNPDSEVSPVFLRTSDTANNNSYVLNTESTPWTLSTIESQIANNQILLDPTFNQTLGLYNNIDGQSGASLANGYDVGYNGGVSDTHPVFYEGAPFVNDPVNVISGEFYIDAVDLSLPGAMPLHVRRNYGSQNLAENEFGFGWKINYVPFLTINNDGTLIYAAEMDGTVIAYRQQTTNVSVFLPTAADNPSLNNNSRDGSGMVFNLFNNRLTLSMPGGTNTYTLTGSDGSVRTFTTRSYPIGGFDRTRPYLDRWQDRVGNFYSFEFGTDSTQPDYGQLRRIQSSSGTFLGFYYDVYGHITEAYAGDGPRLKYEYDKYGDLVKVTLPDQSEINYEYQQLTFTTNGATHTYSTHLIVKELKPDGRVLQNDYDSQRRVTAQYATVGADLRVIRNATFVYANNFSLSAITNLITGKTEMYDYTNRLTTYFYTNGLMRRVLDPLNQTEIQDWFETDTGDGGYRRSLKSQTDKRGLTTTWKYDAKGNPTNIVVQGDLTGEGQNNQQAVSTFTYDASNLPLTSVNTAGTTNKYFYTNTWLPSRIEIYHLNAAGANAVTNSFLYYNVTNALNSAQFSIGLRKREVRAEGSADAAITESLHDYRGFETNVVLFTGTTDPNVTNHFVYNARGEMVEQRDGAGRRIRFAYDALGRPKYRETYEAGQATPLAWEYSHFNANGELVWTDGPRFDPEDYVWNDYDGAGRQTTQIRWRTQAKADGSGVEALSGYDLFAATFSEYDPLSNLKRTIDPQGVVVTNSYDAVNRLIGRKVLETNGAVLTTEGFTREPGGLPTFRTNALGGVTEFQYTWRGQKRFQRNPDGSTNGWTYYLDGRVKREIQRNGAYWESTYDDANRKVTRVFKRSDGTTLATLTEESDRRGNLIRRVDAAGFAFTNKYDGLNRVKWQAGPVLTYLPPPGAPPAPGGTDSSSVQQAVTNYFDAVGLVETNINGVGDKTITYFDALRRPMRRETRNAVNALVRETAWSYAANHHSVTVTNGSGASAVPSTTFTDTFGNPVLDIAYPSSGVKHFTRRRFDAVSNPLSETQASITNSALVEWTTTSLAYDGLNRPVWRSEGDGAITTFAFDAAGNETNRIMPGGASWRRRYNTASQLLDDFDLPAGGGAGTRTNTFAYFTSSSAFAGMPQSRTDGRGVACSYTYDDWLRPLTNTHSGPLPEQNIVTSWKFDVRGVLTNITENFSDPATGPSTSIQRTLDAYAQLNNESVHVGGSPHTGMMQSWDSAGRRARVGYGYGVFGFNLEWNGDGALKSFQGPSGTGTYTYTTAGLIASKTIGPRITTILQRDGAGRALSISNNIGGQTRLVETLTWTGDGLMASQTLARQDFTDARQYFYASLTRRLIEERLNLDASKRYTNTITFDNGEAGKDGVPTRIGQPEANGTAWKGGKDAFARIVSQTNNVVQRAAWGNVNGPATVSISVDGGKMPVALLGTNGGEWRATLELTPGTHQMIAAALHPSGFYTAHATNWFTNSIGNLTATDTLDAIGNVTQKIWKNPDGTTNRTDTLTWDARNCLVRVIARDSSQSGRNWSATYDGLNRLLRTTDVPVTNGVTNVSFAVVVDHYYDPEFEFLEIGVSEDGAKTWKVLGPDTDGTYGGQNGTGGFEAIVPGPELFCPLLSDSLGNLHATFDPKHNALMWYPSRLSANGAVPGYAPVPLGQKGADLGAKCAYGNRAYQSIGMLWMGENIYDPVSAQFQRHDALSYNSSYNGRTPFWGNRITYWDADGRLSAISGDGWRPSLAGYNGFVSDDPTDSWQHILSHGMTASTSDDPFAYTGPSFGARVGNFAGELVNAPAIQAGWYEMRHPDFTTPLGWATFGVATVSVAANTADALANFLPGKAAVQNAIKTGVKEVVQVAEKRLADTAAKIVTDSGAGASYTAADLGNAILNDPIASRAYRILQQQGVDVHLYRSADDFVGTAGGGAVRINLEHNPTVNDALSTLVHEAKHIDLQANTGNLYGLRGTQSGEYAARALEFFYRHGRRPNASERAVIQQQIRNLGY